MQTVTYKALCHEFFCKVDDISDAEYKLECALRVFQMAMDVMPMDTPDDWEKGLAGAETLLCGAAVELRQKVDEATAFWKKLNDGRSEECAQVH